MRPTLRLRITQDREMTGLIWDARERRHVGERSPGDATRVSSFGNGEYKSGEPILCDFRLESSPKIG